MDREAVDVHKITQRQRRPRWEQQRSQRTRHANQIQKVIQKLRGAEGMVCDDKYIDAAQMQRQIIRKIPSARYKHYDLEHLIRQQRNGDTFAPAGTAIRLQFPVPQAICRQKCDQNAKPN